MASVVRLALEAAAIAAYESFVRNQQHGDRAHVQYPDWNGLEPLVRQHWRIKVTETVEKM